MAKTSVKEKVLHILHEHRGTYYSGQELAEQLTVSRTAVWKAINGLREEGYHISGSTKSSESTKLRYRPFARSIP